MRSLTVLLGLVLGTAGCQEPPPPEEQTSRPEAGTESPATDAAELDSNPLKNTYFGDTHIHTAFSADACSVTPDKGASELAAVWRDPEFDPALRAFYYVRVLENPKCRWSTWDAIRAGVPPRPDMHSTIQDRAWSSPIWYRPGQ